MAKFIAPDGSIEVMFKASSNDIRQIKVNMWMRGNVLINEIPPTTVFSQYFFL